MISARQSAEDGSVVGEAVETSLFLGAEIDDDSAFIDLYEGGPAGTYTATFTIPFRLE